MSNQGQGEQKMATPKNSDEFTQDERQLLKRALNKMDQSTGRFLTTAQKEENIKAIAAAKEELAAIATLKLKL